MGDLSGMIAALRRLEAKPLQEDVARRVADKLRAHLLGTLGAGQAPDGAAWAPRKEDGGRAYAGAAGARTTARHSRRRAGVSATRWPTRAGSAARGRRGASHAVVNTPT